MNDKIKELRAKLINDMMSDPSTMERPIVDILADMFDAGFNIAKTINTGIPTTKS